MVPVPVAEYNALYEKAYLNERQKELDEERRRLAEQRAKQEEELKDKASRLEDARKRKEREQRGAIASRNWLLLKHTAEGTYEKSASSSEGGMAVFDFSMELRVFEAEWTVIPLVDAQLITDNWHVERESCQGEGGWEEVALNSESAVLLVQELDDQPPRQVLATNQAGIYRLKFSIYCHVASTRNLNSLGLHLLFPITGLKMRLKHGTNGRRIVRELSINPTAHCTVQEGDGHADISVRLPATKTLEIKWRSLDSTDVEREAAEASDVGLARADSEKKVPQEPAGAPQVTVEAETLHSIADGVLQSSHTLKYSLDAEQAAMSSTRIRVPENARVTSVTGYGVLGWQLVPSSGAQDAGASLVEVQFKSSLISDKIMLLLSTETELKSEEVQLPVLVCQDVLRQTGSFGVVKLANVEVHEADVKGAASVGVDELSEELKYQTTRPIMFAYKALSSNCAVKLNIVKHQQVSVLEAVVETAYYQALAVDTQCMHRFMLTLQNSRQQYLELKGLPSDMRLWSLMVNSVPAKPVQGKDGSLLIPLLVGTGSDSNHGVQKTSVEVAYLSQHAALTDKGTFNVMPPQLNVPISTLLVEVQFPEAYDIEFEGSLQKVTSFSYPLPVPVNNAKGTTIVPTGFNFNTMAAEVQRNGVNVQIPKGGARHRFERLLVVDAGAALNIKYVLPPKEESPDGPFWHRFVACKRRRQ